MSSLSLPFKVKCSAPAWSFNPALRSPARASQALGRRVVMVNSMAVNIFKKPAEGSNFRKAVLVLFTDLWSRRGPVYSFLVAPEIFKLVILV